MAKRHLPLDPETEFCASLAISMSGQVGDVFRVPGGVGQMVVDLKAISANEGLRLLLQGSDAEDFTVGGEGQATRVENLAVLDLGHSSKLFAGATTQGPGRYLASFTTGVREGDADCPWLRLYAELTGGSATVSAWLSKAP